MRILPLLLIVCITFTGGCARRYYSPALKQLKGHHISTVAQRIDRFVHVDTSGLFRNYYYFYRDCPYAGYDEITYNSYGVILNREPVYKCGEIYFETDKDGVITNFVENGHIPDTNYQPIFKDLIVIEK